MKYSWILCIFVILQFTFSCYTLDEDEGESKYTYCAYIDKDIWKMQQQLQDEAAVEYERQRIENGDDTEGSSLALGEVLPDNKTIKCNEHDFCYTLWQAGRANSKDGVSLLKQGCWSSTSRACYSSNCEAITGSPDSLNDTRFCCCTGDMCNINVTDLYVHTTPIIVATQKYQVMANPNYKIKTTVIAIVSVFMVALITSLSYLAFRLWRKSKKEYVESAAAHLIEAPATPSFELDQLKIADLIDRGRYGEVWRGTLNEMEVAVKIFGPHQKQYYINERDIYMLPMMEHDALPRFYGAEERIGENSMPQYLIVMTYVPLGTLTQFLKENTIDWFTLCRMYLSCAGGLAHLHGDLTKGDKFKPSIAHRDFNSRNVLVKADLSCCICDMGFAMKIQGSKFFRNGHEENAEHSSLTDVGTLRYMAPEVLDGAVNLRDCEASLKQIDVYALGLVLWEIASRCSDLYQGMPTPTYQLPFQPAVGIHPTFDEMQLLVSKKKERPKFPDVWKDYNPAIRALKETIDDCWDQDAEARLTSLCVEERVLEMITLWDVRHKGVTPTVNPTSSMTSDGNVVRNDVTGDQAERQATTGVSSLITDSLSEPIVGVGGTSTHPTRLPSVSLENSVSASTTVTELTMSPSVEGPSEPVAVSNKSNRNMNFAKNNRVLQPHQGQNPTVERNTHKRSDEELTVLGNTLVDKSVAKAHHQGHSEAEGHGTTDMHHDDIFDAIADNLESSLVQNDSLSQQQRQSVVPLLNATANGLGNVGSIGPPVANPPPSISYVQNQVNLSEPLVVRPKMPNLPGNGSTTSAKASSNNIDKKSSKFRFKRPKCDKSKAEKSSKGLSFPFFGRKSQGHNSYTNSDDLDFYPTENLVHNPLPLAQSILCKPGPSGNADDMRIGNSTYGQQRNLARDNGIFADIQGKSNLDPRPVSTEVRLMNGTPIVRPTSLPVESRGGAVRASGGATATAGVPGYNIDQSAPGMASVCHGRGPASAMGTDRTHGAPDGVGVCPTVRGVSPAARSCSVDRVQNVNINPNCESSDGRLMIAEVGVAKLQNTSQSSNGQPALVKVKGKSHSSGDLSPSHSAVSSQISTPSVYSGDNSLQSPATTSLQQLQHGTHHSSRLANSLQLNNHGNHVNNNYNKPQSQLETNHNVLNAQKSNGVSGTGDRNMLNNSLEYIQATQTVDRHPKKRHKAPVTSLKSGTRTSLCDDRVMSQSAGNVNATSSWHQDDKGSNKSAISLQQFGSLDINFQQVQDFKC